MKGWIALHRKIAGHWIWRDKTKSQRWLELLMLAAWERNTTRYGKHKIVVERGQIVTSTRALMHFWKTNNHVVKEFLAELEDEGMITVERTNGIAIITICNFDKHQNVTQGILLDETENERVSDDTGLQDGLQERLPYKQDNNIINNNNSRSRHARTHEEIFDEFFDAGISVEAFCMQEGIDIETCKKLAREVLNDWELTGKTHESDQDAKDHLLNHLRKKIANRRKQHKSKQKDGQRDNPKSGGDSTADPLARAKVYRADLSDRTKHD